MTVLQIPLRARLVAQDDAAALEHRQDLARKAARLGALLLDVPQPKLPPLPRRCYGRNPGKRTTDHGTR